MLRMQSNGKEKDADARGKRGGGDGGEKRGEKKWK